MSHSKYDLTEEDLDTLRKQVAKLVEVNGLWTNPVDIVLLAMHQLRTNKWIELNRNEDGSKKEKPPKPKGLFDQIF